MHRLPLVSQTPLTTYVPEAREAIAQCAARLLDVPPPWSASIADAPVEGDGFEGWRVCIALAAPERPTLRVEVRAPAPGAQGMYVGAHLVFGYRKGPAGEDPWSEPAHRPLLEALRARAAVVDAEGPTRGALARFYEEFAAIRGFASVEDRHLRYLAPREAILRLGFRCNQRCDFCWQGRDWPEAPASMYRTWIDEFAAAGARTIHFTGGEPTIHPELIALVEHARSHAMEVWIQTNAIRLAKPDYLRALVAAGLRGAFVSHHAHDAAVSDAMTRAPGTHRMTERGIVAALDAGVAIEINTLVEARNVALLIDHARHLVERFHRNGATPLRMVNYSHPGPSLDPRDTQEHMVPLDVVRPQLRAAVRLLLDAGIAVEASGSCGFPSCMFVEDPTIEMFTEPEAQVHETSPDRVYPRECARCTAQARCVGLRETYVKRFGARGVVPFR